MNIAYALFPEDICKAACKTICHEVRLCGFSEPQVSKTSSGQSFQTHATQSNTAQAASNRMEILKFPNLQKICQDKWCKTHPMYWYSSYDSRTMDNQCYPSFRIYMELCGPNISESAGSLSQVKPLPHHSVHLCRMQACGRHMHNAHRLTHQPWVNHAAPSVASGPAVALRHRVNGATVAGCSSQGCAASRLAEEAALAGGAGGYVLVTGGGGYFGSRLGRELASQGLPVILLDINKPPCDIPDGAIFCQVRGRGDTPDLTAFPWMTQLNSCKPLVVIVLNT